MTAWQWHRFLPASNTWQEQPRMPHRIKPKSIAYRLCKIVLNRTSSCKFKKRYKSSGWVKVKSRKRRPACINRFFTIFNTTGGISNCNCCQVVCTVMLSLKKKNTGFHIEIQAGCWGKWKTLSGNQLPSLHSVQFLSSGNPIWLYAPLMKQITSKAGKLHTTSKS